MHELSIATSIIDLAQEEAEKRGAAVLAIHLKLGPLAGVIKEARTGEYWLDIPAYRDWANRRRRRIIALMVVVVMVALGALVSAGVGGIAR